MAQLHVVTGASRGIGLELARQLSARGEAVIATARRPDEARELRELDVRVERLDVADPASVADFARRIDGEAVDVLLNNAGKGGGSQPFAKVDWADVRRYFEVNSIGPLRVTQALLPHLRRGTRRLVASVTSRMGSIADNGSGGSYGYRASKCALNMLNKSLSIDLADEGFTCVVLHPGWVQTDMGGRAAPLDVRESVAGLLRVLDKLKASDTGKFLDHAGATIPW